MTDLQIEYRAIDALIPHARNAKQHTDAQVAQIAASIREFGWGAPILVDGQNNVVAGHGRLLAARKLGLTQVPVVPMNHLTDIQRRALILADNKIGENAAWDTELLTLELEELKDAGFDLNLTGFSSEEWEALMSGDDETKEGLSDDDAVPDVEENPISQPGDLWLLGEHKLLCGDATKSDDYQILLGEELVDMAFTDPPYNVNYANSAKDKLRGKHRPIMNDNLGDEFDIFLTAACQNILKVTKGAVYIAMSSSELDTLQAAFRAAGGKWSTFIIWAKNTFTLGRADYQRQYEPILYGWRDGTDHYWCGARDQGDVWQIKKPQKNDLHPCLCPGTEVFTESGWQVIESLVEGDCVLTADGMFCSVEFVSSHFIQKSVFRLAVSGVEHAVDATDNHPFLVLRDGELAWIEASQIVVGDEICSPQKVMSENGTATDYEWNTTSSGKEILEPSQTDIASIISTTTSKTMTFQTCNLSPTLSTSGFTPVVTSAMAFGGSSAALAKHINRLLQNTGISVQKDGLMDGAADHATSKKSYSFVLRSVSCIKKINYAGLVWNVSVKDSPTFETRIGMSHNTMKPVELVERAIRNSSKTQDIVLDPFGGSGTTLMACEKSGRRARLIELDPKYVDVIVRRWQQFTGQEARLQEDGQAFTILSEQRKEVQVA